MDVKSSFSGLKGFVRLIRWKNLLMIVILQYLLQYTFLVPKLKAYQFEPTLDTLHFFLLVLCTIIIAAGGYIINDIYDYHIDRINKPNKQSIGKYLSLRKAMRYYIIVLVLGLLLSIYLAWHVDNLRLAILYFVAVSSLWLYSKILKRTSLGGNIFVGLFCAFVAIIVAFAERHALVQILQDNFFGFKNIAFQFGVFSIFAFLSTLFREIIKDIEDIEGDRLNNCHTLPIAYGVKFSKNIATSINITIFLLLTYLIYTFYNNQLWSQLIYLMLLIFLPVLYSEYLLQKAHKKVHFKQLSNWSKYIMFSGIFLIYLMK